LAGEPWPLYAAVDEPTVWAEWAHVADAGVDPRDDRRFLCVFECDLVVLDMRNPANCVTLGVTLDELRDDWAPGAPNPACLRVAQAAMTAGASAYIVPSAVPGGTWSVDVFPWAFGQLRQVSRAETTPNPPI